MQVNGRRGSGAQSGGASIDQALEYAMGAIGRGDLKRGKAALSWVLQREPENAAAWFWMACCVDDEESKEECYKRA